MMRKTTRLSIAKSDVSVSNKDTVFRSVSFNDFDFIPEPGMLYVIARAISSRVNANYDEWPAHELRKAYQTFIGKPVFVDHNNNDPSRTRGVVIDAKLHESKLASGDDDVWISLLIEVDAEAFPKLAQAILNGDIDTVSMGANVEATECSACGNIATDPSEFCEHIARMKGRYVTVERNGKKEDVLVYERCINPSFFEISFVFEPADESAFVIDKMLVPGSSSGRMASRIRYNGESVAAYKRRLHGLVKAAAFRRKGDDVVLALPRLDDFETICPECGAPQFNGVRCERCGYEQAPDGLDDPDVDNVDDEDALETKKKNEKNDEKKEKKRDDKEGGRMSRYEEFAKTASPTRRLSRSDIKRIMEERRSARPSKRGSLESVTSRLSDSDRRRRLALARLRLARRRLALARRKRLTEERVVRSSATKTETSPAARRSPSRLSARRRRLGYDQEPAFMVGPYDTDAPLPTPEEPVVTTSEEAIPDAVDDVTDLDNVTIEARRRALARARARALARRKALARARARALARRKALAERRRQSRQRKPGTRVSLGSVQALQEKAEKYARIALAYKRAAERLRQRVADDVTNLDEPVNVDVAPDATVDVERPTDEGNQTALADTPTTVNDGSEAGPVPPNSDEENPGAQVGPYAGETSGNPASAVTARILRITSLVEDRIRLGLVPEEQKYAEVARLEKMDDRTIAGIAQATEEFKTAMAKRSSVKKVRTAMVQPTRVPDLGSEPRIASQGGEGQVDDYLVFLS